ncbi:hypothetical protein B0H11DRAFT_2423771 [Mycena galericulata]|nr:hypothetical protein B0H11DRAFT_2423771 [Mycena galericulata]
MEKWKKTDPSIGNRWRQLSHGHRVVAFPIWLYCDDISGNTSKKWNKHNSFLFTAAGLPREYVHLESNIHLLDGIVDQLEDCQRRGIWAWDSSNNELVLVIPSVLAMLGDNPMQSEFACHIGFRGKYFCRVCWVKGVPDDEEEEEEAEDNDPSDRPQHHEVKKNKKQKKKKNKKKKTNESVADMISRVTQFMSKGRPRNKDESMKELRSQFTAASVVGGQACFKRMKTESGIKDTFQGAFLERIFAVSTKKKRTKVQKQADISGVLRNFPADITSPVWRIKDLDPHQDTPVEILHVILLGFVKYFWRDAVARVKKSDKEILISHLSSFNVSGLGISPLSGHTLVNYSVQLLHLCGNHKFLTWTNTEQLEDAIKHFLDCTCSLTLQWFNKPNVHSNRHSPSHDIASRMAKGNRIRHLLSGGFFPRDRSVQSVLPADKSSQAKLNAEPWMSIPYDVLKSFKWIQAGKSPLEITKLNSFGSRLLGWETKNIQAEPGVCEGQGILKMWSETQSAAAGILFPFNTTPSMQKAYTPKQMVLANGDVCTAGDWIVWTEVLNQVLHHHIGQVVEVVQIQGSPALRAGKADFVLVMRAIPGEAHTVYKMRQLSPVHTEKQKVQIQDIKCTINIQHNCVDNNCQSTRTRVIFNEREATSERALQVQHTARDDMIINTGQMRDAAALDPFRFRPNALLTANVIRESAQRFFENRQAQKKSTTPITDIPQSEDIEGEPLRKKSKQSGSPASAMNIANITHPSSAPRVPSGLRQTSTANDSHEGAAAQTPRQANVQFSNIYQSTYMYPGA